MSSPRFPILFVTSSRIGDAVLSSGLIRRLLDEVPHARFTIAAGPLSAPLFRDTPGLERLIALEKEPAGLHWLSLWRQVRGRRWGLIVDLRGSGLARMLRARRRAVKRSAPATLEPVHKVVEAARVLRVEDDPPAPSFYTSEEREAAAEALLGEGGPILAIAPAANWAGKTWPSERFAVVAAELLGRTGPMRGGRLLLLGGPDDRFAAEAVRRVIPRARLIDAVGRVDLLTAYACLKRARLFIGNDSGLMHLAAAAGAPTLGLFGPSDDRLYGPWGAKARALRGPRDFDTFKRIDPDLNQVVCHMFDLPTSWVMNAAKELLEDTAADYPPLPGPEPTPVRLEVVEPVSELQNVGAEEGVVVEAPAGVLAAEPQSDAPPPRPRKPRRPKVATAGEGGAAASGPAALRSPSTRPPRKRAPPKAPPLASDEGAPVVGAGVGVDPA